MSPDQLRHTPTTRVKQVVRHVRYRMRRRPADNVAYNRELWDYYAANWDERLTRMDQLQETGGSVPERLELLGEEWGLATELDWVVDEWIAPYAGPDSHVAEIGPGGGRIAVKVVDRVGTLYCCDVSRKMLGRLEQVLGRRDDVQYLELDGTSLPPALEGRLDLVYSFDVFVHLDLHTQWGYLQSIKRALKPGGHAFLQTANLAAPGGWERFSRQDRYTVEGHYFVVPQIIHTLVDHAGLELIRESAPDPELDLHHHYNQNFLYVVRKPA